MHLLQEGCPLPRLLVGSQPFGIRQVGAASTSFTQHLETAVWSQSMQTMTKGLLRGTKHRLWKELCSENQNHHKGSLKCRLLGLRLSASHSAGLGRLQNLHLLQVPRSCWLREHPLRGAACTIYSWVDTHESTQSLLVSDLCFQLLLPRIRRTPDQRSRVSVAA